MVCKQCINYELCALERRGICKDFKERGQPGTNKGIKTNRKRCRDEDTKHRCDQ